MPQVRQIADNLIQELRRGLLILAILSRLQKEHYGYALREQLAVQGLEVPEGTLYPLLRRLEAQGLLDSRWQLGESRPRRYYKTSVAGQQVLTEVARQWSSQVQVLRRILASR